MENLSYMKKVLRVIGIGIGVAAVLFFVFRFFAAKNWQTCMQGEDQVAIEACTFRIKYLPNDLVKISALMFRSEHYQKKGLVKEALADMYAMVAIIEKGGVRMSARTIGPVYDRLVLLNSMLGNFEEALRFSELSIKNDPGQALSYVRRASALLSFNKYSAALSDLDKADSLGYKDRTLYFLRGMAYRGLGAYEQSYRSLKNAEALNNVPQEAPVLNAQLGLACFALKRYDEALPYLKNALAAGVPCDECPAALAAAEKALLPPPPPPKPVKKKRGHGRK